jgi:hypothetical protein
MKSFKQFITEKKLPKFQGFTAGSKVKFNDPKGADTSANKVHTFVGTVVKDTTGQDDVWIESDQYKERYGDQKVKVPAKNIQGVV